MKGGKADWLKALSRRISKNQRKSDQQQQHRRQQLYRTEANDEPSSSTGRCKEEDPISLSEDEDEDFVERKSKKGKSQIRERLLQIVENQNDGNVERESDAENVEGNRKGMSDVPLLIWTKPTFWGKTCTKYNAKKLSTKILETTDILQFSFLQLQLLKAVVMRPPLPSYEGSDGLTPSQLSILLGSMSPLLSHDGFIFLWVEKQNIEMAAKCMSCWSIKYVENLTWVIKDARSQPCRDRHKYICSSHLTCLIGRKVSPSCIEMHDRHHRHLNFSLCLSPGDTLVLSFFRLIP